MTNFNTSSFRFFERKVAQGIALSDFSGSLLYHTKNYQGTTTVSRWITRPPCIIPYQELPGNYNTEPVEDTATQIIPYQELPGNYNGLTINIPCYKIIPYQELPGNYNLAAVRYIGHRDYTIPRTTRELQPMNVFQKLQLDYTIPRTTRELQPSLKICERPLKLYHTKNYQGTTT